MKNLNKVSITNNELLFVDEYLAIYKRLLFDSINNEKFIMVKNLFKEINKNKGKIIFVGNGASASLSSHAATDLTKQGKIKAIAFNDHNLVTALGMCHPSYLWFEFLQLCQN